MHIDQPEEGTFKLFTGEAAGIAVRLPDWTYPVVCNTVTGQIQFDNFGGRWGEQKELDRFMQAYAVERARVEAHKKGTLQALRFLTLSQENKQSEPAAKSKKRIAQWGNNSDDTSPMRYEGSGNIPSEGIFRTLEHWDMRCDYENGVTLHLMDDQTAKDVVTKYKPGWRGGDGVVFHGTNGWIGNISGGFYASDNTIWKVPFKEGDETLEVSSEHNRNFIDCVKSRKETMCPVEMAIRCDTICHMTNIAAQTGRVINWDPAKEEIVGDAEASKMLTRPYREQWKVW